MIRHWRRITLCDELLGEKQFQSIATRNLLKSLFKRLRSKSGPAGPSALPFRNDRCDQGHDDHEEQRRILAVISSAPEKTPGGSPMHQQHFKGSAQRLSERR